MSSTAVVLDARFESNVAGWKTNDKAVRLAFTSPGHNSNGAAKLTTATSMTALLNEQHNAAAATVKGNVYEANAWIKTSTPNVSGQIRLREVSGSTQVGVTKTGFQLTDTLWHRVSVSHTALSAGSEIDLNVMAWNVAKGEDLQVDDVVLTRTTPVSPPSPTPTSSAPSPATTSSAPSPATTSSAPSPATTSSAPSPPAKSPTIGWGMSAPAGEWDQRVREVGPGLKARRIFLTSFGAGLSLPQQALADGLYPVISFKSGGYTWAQVAAGQADDDLRSLAARLDALPGNVFVAVHHEPAKDGPAADWAAMQERALPILGAADNVTVGVIGNGWWWSAQANGYTDAEIANYITPGVRGVAEVIAADTYDNGTEDAGVKIRRMSAWASRVGVTALGIGEFNGQTAAAITNAMDAVKADPRFRWACVFNSNAGIGDVLTGDRLAAFQAGMA